MNNKAKIVIEILIFLIIAILSSSTVLLMVKMGILTPKENAADVKILNAEFIPFTRGGTLTVREFYFCTGIDENYVCDVQKKSFSKGDKVNFYFVVESSVKDGMVMLVENYRVLSPSGRIILEAEDKDNFYYEKKSNLETEQVIFRDFFNIWEDESGEYTFELILRNPLIEKDVTLSKTFYLEESR